MSIFVKLTFAITIIIVSFQRTKMAVVPKNANVAKSQQNGTMDKQTFRRLCQQRFDFADAANRSIEEKIDNLFDEIDTSKAGRLHGDDLRAYEKWWRILTRPKSALLIIDVQNDFINGSLSIGQGPARQNPRDVIPLINRLLDEIRFDVVVYTFDWHPTDHISFVENAHLRKIDTNYSGTTNNNATARDKNPKVFDTVRFVKPDGSGVVQKLWPKHCVQNTSGAELHPNLRLVDDGRALKIYKGDNPDLDSYSAFFDNQRQSSTPLDAELKKRNITDVYTCGLAYDYCVAATCFDAQDLGYKTALLKHQSKGLDFQAMDEVDRKMGQRDGVVVAKDEKLKRIVQGQEIPWQWATYAWNNLHKF